MRGTGIAVWALWLGWAAAAQCAGKAVESLNREGALLFRDHKPAEAAERFRESLRKEPAQPRIAKLLGLSLQLVEDFEQAEKAFQTAAALDPRDPEPWYYLGRLRYVQNFFGKAEEALRESVRRAKQDYRPHYYLALTLEAEGRIEEAEREYREAIRLNRQGEKPDPGPHHGLGVLLAKLGRLEEARAELERAKSLDPAVWQYYFELAKIRYRRKELPAAEQELLGAIATKSAEAKDLARVYNLLGRVLTDMGRPEEAGQAFALQQTLEARQ